MKRKLIHFAHANSFPAKTYNQLFSFLAAEFEINYLERHAHDPRFPVTEGWEFLKQELRQEIESRYSEPVIGLGHSLGGILHFLVAVERPELYRALILLDAPLVSRLSGMGLRILRRTNLIEKFPLVKATKYRRTRWHTREEAFEHFRRKEAFGSFNEKVLRDYVDHGTVETEQGIDLLFNSRIEAEIYRTVPADFSKYRGKLKVPAAYIGGNRSREARLARLGFMRRHFPIDFHFVEGSHLFPFENPQLAAQSIREALLKLGNK